MKDLVVSGAVLVVVVDAVEAVVLIEVVAVVDVSESDPAQAANMRATTMMERKRFMCAKRFYASRSSRYLQPPLREKCIQSFRLFQ